MRVLQLIVHMKYITSNLNAVNKKSRKKFFRLFWL